MLQNPGVAVDSRLGLCWRDKCSCSKKKITNPKTVASTNETDAHLFPFLVNNGHGNTSGNADLCAHFQQLLRLPFPHGVNRYRALIK